MKIYAPKTFKRCVFDLLIILIGAFIAMKFLNCDKSILVIWIAIAINPIMGIYISLSEERVHKNKLSQELKQTATENVFGKKNIYIKWIQWLLLFIGVFIFNLGFIIPLLILIVDIILCLVINIRIENEVELIKNKRKEK